MVKCLEDYFAEEAANSRMHPITRHRYRLVKRSQSLQHVWIFCLFLYYGVGHNTRRTHTLSHSRTAWKRTHSHASYHALFFCFLIFLNLYKYGHFYTPSKSRLTFTLCAVTPQPAPRLMRPHLWRLHYVHARNQHHEQHRQHEQWQQRGFDSRQRQQQRRQHTEPALEELLVGAGFWFRSTFVTCGTGVDGLALLWCSWSCIAAAAHIHTA